MKKFDKYKYYLIVLLSAIIIITLVYIFNSVSPFGKYSLLAIDFYHQYGPMLGELYRRIYSHSELVYSFSMGLGLPFFRNYFNYLSSPVNLIILLFKQRDLLTSYSFVIGIKAILSTLTISIFFKWKFGEDYKLVPLALLYGFSAYFIAYYWNIMWIDGLYMTPLITLGIEKLVKDDKRLLYIISLAVMLFTNYFIGYMLCIYSVLYFITYLALTLRKFDKKIIIKKGTNFVVSSLLVGVLCAFFLVPLFLSLKSISATGGEWPTSQYYDFTIWQFLFSHFSGVTSSVLKSGGICSPNISCGIVSFALLILFWLNKGIKHKEKLCYTCLFMFMILSFGLPQLDYIWHGMHVPNDLPYRYSFIYSFILMIMAAYGVKNIKKIKFTEMLFTYLGLMICLLVVLLIKYEYLNDTMVLVNTGILSLFFLGYVCYQKHKKWGKYIYVILLLATIGERVMVINNSWNIDQDLDNFYRLDSTIKEITENIKHDETDQFYRVQRMTSNTYNDPSWYGYYGLVSFSSMEYESVSKLLFNLGTSGNQINSYEYRGNTPVFDMMFNLKYLVGDVNSPNYTLYATIDGYQVYQNKYSLPLMYGVNKSALDWDIYSDIPIYNQNNFMKKATGVDKVLSRVSDINKEIIYDDEGHRIVHYQVKNTRENYYFYLSDDKYNVDFVVFNHELYYTNDEYDYYKNVEYLFVDRFHDYQERYVINAVNSDEYIDIYIGYNSQEIIKNIDLYTVDNDKFLEAYNYLSERAVTISEFKEKYIEGKIDAKEDMVIYTSIPYDSGWSVFVDNKKVAKEKVGNALLAFTVSKGEHTIKLKYHIPYFRLLIVVDIIIICIHIFKKNKLFFRGKNEVKRNNSGI